MHYALPIWMCKSLKVLACALKPTYLFGRLCCPIEILPGSLELGGIGDVQLLAVLSPERGWDEPGPILFDASWPSATTSCAAKTFPVACQLSVPPAFQSFPPLATSRCAIADARSPIVFDRRRILRPITCGTGSMVARLPLITRFFCVPDIITTAMRVAGESPPGRT